MKKRTTFFNILVLLVCIPSSAIALTLQEGLAIVAEKGRDVALAKAEQEAAEGAVSVARSSYLPWVDLYGRETWFRYEPQAKTASGVFSLSEREYPSLSFKVTQLIYDFGRTTSSISASKYNARAKDANALRARNRAALEFIATYLDLLEAEKLLQVAADEVARYEAHQKDTEARYSAGVITRNEVLQARVTLSDSRQRYLTAENLRALTASRVNSLLLRPLTETVQPRDIEESPAAGITLEDAWQTAETESPDLKDIIARIKAQEESNSAIRSEYLPTITLSGGYDYEENRYMVRNDNWSLVAGINVNLFAGGQTRAKILVGASELKGLVVTRDKVLDAVRLEVQRNYLELQSSRQKVEVTRGAVAQAEENLRLQRLRYQEGVGTATEVLDAVTLLTVTRTNAWKALYGVKRAEAGLLSSMGRDLAGMYGK
jgi:outer membrane protein TolC